MFVLTEIQCPKLHSLVNGYLSSSNDSYNASVTYMCNSGYHIRNGDQTRTCLSTGLWSGRVPYCERGKLSESSVSEELNLFFDV